MLGATLLRVNLSTGQIRKESVPETIVRDFIGGRGVASKLVMATEVMGENFGGPEDMLKIDGRIWNLERLFNNAAGLTRADDSLPPRITSEPLTEGMSKGHVVDLEPMLNEYYQLRGWDNAGRPTAEKLRELRLASVIACS